MPDSAVSLLTGGRPDAVDQFELDVADPCGWTAEQWARAMFEDARPILTRVRTGGVAGLVTSPPQPPGTVRHWRIIGTGPTHVLMTTRLPLMTEQVLVQRAHGAVSLTTAMQFTHRLARPSWAALSIGHRQVAPRVLRRAVQEYQKDRAG